MEENSKSALRGGNREMEWMGLNSIEEMIFKINDEVSGIWPERKSIPERGNPYDKQLEIRNR